MTQILESVKDFTSESGKAILTSCTETIGASDILAAVLGTALATAVITTKISEQKFDIKKEINANEWKAALVYDDDQVDKLIELILEDYRVKPTREMKDWLQGSINSLILAHEKQFGIDLPDRVQKMIFNLIVRMAYDRLVVKNVI